MTHQADPLTGTWSVHFIDIINDWLVTAQYPMRVLNAQEMA